MDRNRLLIQALKYRPEGRGNIGRPKKIVGWTNSTLRSMEPGSHLTLNEHDDDDDDEEEENNTALRSRMYAILSPGAKMTKLGVPPGREDFIVLWVCCMRRVNSSATCGRPSLISSLGRSATHGRGAELSSTALRVCT